MLNGGWLARAAVSCLLYCLYGTFLHQVNCYIDVYFYMFICRVWLARAAVSCFYLLFHLFLQVVIRPVRQHVSFMLNHWHLGGLTCKGSCSPLTSFSIFELFQFVLPYPCCFYDLFRGKRTLLAWSTGPFFLPSFKYLIFRCCISFGWG